MIPRLLLASALSLCAASATLADDIKMAVTTSFHNSGLAEVLLPEIKADLDLDVHLVVVGTGQALRLGRAGDVDAILVHAKSAEEKFVSEGYGTHRTPFMYNDFVLIGPAGDPAHIAQAQSAAEALVSIQSTGARFVSRGDDSGTHKKELSLWSGAGLTPDNFATSWYQAAGAGMGASLNTASAMNAYIMSDRASWLKFGNKGDLALLLAGDPVLFNQYAYIPVNPATHPHVNSDLTAKLETWLLSARAKDLINGYRLNGEQLFIYNAP